jgi:hypothetical protein
MTRADLYDWLKSNGCNFNPIPEFKAHVIFVENPKTGAQYWINLPINEQPVKDFTVYKTCMSLCLPIPTQVEYMGDVQTQIDRMQKIQKIQKKKSP